MRKLALVVALVAALSVLPLLSARAEEPAPVEVVRLDFGGVPKLTVKLPDETLEPRLFRTRDRGIGWVVRRPSPPPRWRSAASSSAGG